MIKHMRLWVGLAVIVSGGCPTCAPSSGSSGGGCGGPINTNLNLFGDCNLAWGEQEPGAAAGTVVLRGSAPAGATVQLFEDTRTCTGTVASTTTADSNGEFSFTVVAGTDAGNRDFAALTADSSQGMDADGGTRGCCEPTTVALDTMAPSAPTTFTWREDHSTGCAETISGAAEARTFVTVFLDAACTQPITPCGTTDPIRVTFEGAFVVYADVPVPADDAFYVVVKDVAGNTSPCSGPATMLGAAPGDAGM